MESTTNTCAAAADGDPIHRYQLCVQDRQYTQYNWLNTTTNVSETLDIDPIALRIFHGDIIEYRPIPTLRSGIILRFAVDLPVFLRSGSPTLSLNKDLSGEPIQVMHSPKEKSEWNVDFDRFSGENRRKTTIQVVNSPTRSAEYLPGVLVLVGNRTYGRSQDKKRLLYQCIPDNKRLPVFLVPYEHKQIGFSKHMKNKYVLFKWVSWKGPIGTHPQGSGQGGTTHPMGKDIHPQGQGGTTHPMGKDIHPMGQLTEVIGDVDHLESFYEYQLYSKSLHSSIKDMTDCTRKQLISPGSMDAAIQSIRDSSMYNIEDRTHLHVFTIDPPNSLDYDDGFSIRTDSSGRVIVSVYIANVFVWLEHFQLWESFSNRVATIYLPDRFRRPMLPTILSDTLCSLQKGHIRFALAMDFEVDVATSSITPLDSTSGGPKMVAIRPTANYAYESPALFRDADYQRLKCATPGAPKNSHNLVTWWMIHTNSYVAEYMKTVRRTGIFRIGTVALDTTVASSETSNVASNPTVPESNTIPELDSAIDSSLELLSEDAARVVLHWKHMMGQYVAFQDGIDASQFCGGREAKPPDPTHSLRHVWLNRSAYMHMTSPIRRLVDLLNQMILFESVLSPAAKTFVETWMGKLDYINTTMRSIRKVESTCQLISLCTNRPDVLEASHQGIVFDKTSNTTTTIDDTSSVYNYMVYLEDLRMLVRMPRSNRSVANHSRHMFRLFLFETEHSTKKKIRIGFVDQGGRASFVPNGSPGLLLDPPVSQASIACPEHSNPGLPGEAR